MFTRKTHTLKLSSSPALGAQMVNEGGSSFVVDLKRDLNFPMKASNLRLHLQSAIIPNSTPNISGTDDFQITFVDRRRRIGSFDNTPQNTMTNSYLSLEVDPDGNFVEETNPARHCILTITPRQGLYNVTEIGEYIIGYHLVHAFNSEEYEDAVVTRGQPSTGLVTIDLRIPFTTLTFASGYKKLIGLDTQLTMTNDDISRTYVRYSAENVANMLPTQYYFVQCNLVDHGMQVPSPTESGGQNIIARIPIVGGASELSHFEPLLPPDFPCEHIKYGQNQLASVTLLDDHLLPANMNNQPYTITLVITYTVPSH